MAHVIVVGAGVSGLAAAVRIKDAVPGVRLTVLESAPRPGGNVWTEHADGFAVEHGPNGLFDAKPHALDLCRRLGLGGELIVASEASRKNRFLYLDGKLRKLPASPLSLLTADFLSPAGKLRLLSEPFRGRGGKVPADESVAAFARRRFGREAADTVIDALVTGIHAGDPKHLSVLAAFPRLVAFEADAGSVVRGLLRSMKRKRAEAKASGKPKPGPQRLWSFRRGLRVLVEAAAAELGDALRLGVSVERLERAGRSWRVRANGEWLSADAVVLTCPPHRQADIVADTDATLAAEMASIRYSPIAVVAVGYRAADAPQPDGFGYIAPQRTRRDALGVQWCSAVFPDRAPPGFVLWRALCGGVNRPDVLTWDDDTLVRRVHAELGVTMGVRGQPAFVRVIRWPRAIPQYEVGHPARVARIEALAANHPNLFVGGNGYHGVALGDCAAQGEMLADRVANYAKN